MFLTRSRKYSDPDSRWCSTGVDFSSRHKDAQRPSSGVSSAHTLTFRPWLTEVPDSLIFPPADNQGNKKSKRKWTHNVRLKDRPWTSIESTEAPMTFEERLFLLSSVLYNICKSARRKCTCRVCLFICCQSVSCWPLCRESNHSHSASLCFCSHAHNPLRR